MIHIWMVHLGTFFLQLQDGRPESVMKVPSDPPDNEGWIGGNQVILNSVRILMLFLRLCLNQRLFLVPLTGGR